MLQKEVTEADIAAVVSRWSSIPIDQMLEGEREKLLQMETAIGVRVIGQAEAVAAVSDAVRRAQASRSRQADMVLHFPGTTRRRQDRADKGSGGFSV